MSYFADINPVPHVNFLQGVGNCGVRVKKDCPYGQSLVIPWKAY